MLSVDLNSDLGEGMDNDHFIMPYISSANIACGYHAGNERIMCRTIELAIEYDLSIGAHPGFKDKSNFGRKELKLKDDEYYRTVLDQLILLQKLIIARGGKMRHVKPHGALYNMAAKNSSIAGIVARAVFDFEPSLIVYGLSGSHLIYESEKLGLTTASEVFADRTYQENGQLTPRSQKDALIHDNDIAVQQVLEMITECFTTSVSGKKIPIKAETICIHGDSKNAITFAKTIYHYLKDKKVEIHSTSK